MSGLRQTVQILKAYAKRLWTYANDRPIFLWAQAVGFKALVAIVPVAAIALGLFGPGLARLVRNLVPDAQSRSFIGLLEGLQRAGDSLTLFGTIGFVFVAMTLFSTLRSVLDAVFEGSGQREHSIIRGYLTDLRMTAQIGLFMVLSLAISFTIQALNVSDPAFLAQIGLDTVWIQAGWRRVLQAAAIAVPALLSCAVFYQIYYFVPPEAPPRRSALAGAIFAVVLWELAKVGFAVYAARLGLVERYAGSGGGLGDVFGVIIAFVFWAYYSGLIFILGAFVVRIHASRQLQPG